MAGLRIIHPGMLTTVQDLGRPGHTALGVSPSGAADTISLRVGNRLVGNADGAAALEMTLQGGEFGFDSAMAIALAGATARASLISGGSEQVLASWSVAIVRAGDRLRVGPMLSGARSYLCVPGGICVDPVLGSRSTHVATGLGPRPLGAGDLLPIGIGSRPPRELPAGARRLVTEAIERRTLRITARDDDPAMAALATALCDRPFTVRDRSDRQGIRLAGALSTGAGSRGRMITEGLPPGAVQLPESGEPIILLADRPTTGGYPVIACIASADLPACGQLRPREAVRFQRVTIDEARRCHREQHQQLNDVLPPVE